ncbi:MAG: hypothetical protein JO280_01360 [Mycobacteriaceae bacterium]|nr:hypothetical protein [Mycobacteriaceae bacterium]
MRRFGALRRIRPLRRGLGWFAGVFANIATRRVPETWGTGKKMSGTGKEDAGAIGQEKGNK